MAERLGFEPRVRKRTTVFETAPFDHSGTSPHILSPAGGRGFCGERLLGRCSALSGNLIIDGLPMLLPEGLP